MELTYLLATALQFAVCFLLICGVYVLLGSSGSYRRALLAAGVGILPSLLTMFPIFRNVSENILYAFSLLATCGIAFGVRKQGLIKCVVYTVIRFGAEQLGSGQGWLLLILGGVALGLFYRRKWGRYLPVRLCCRGKIVECTALLDTGHDLRDPISGKTVIVVDASVAKTLTGLTPKQLSNPIENVGVMVGLRLIPYKTVGDPCGFLLGITAEQCKVGDRKETFLVAMSPNILDEQGKFQALIGGIL